MPALTTQDASPQPALAGATEAEIGYRSLHEEVSVPGLPVEGRLPSWLTGTLLRNGPALFEDDQRPVRHWFDGQAMLHRFTISDGSVSYANRFLRTRAHAAMRDGRLAYSEFATDPCRSIFRRAMTLFDAQITDNAAVSIARLGDEYHAMTEGPMSVRFDPRTLATLGYGERTPGTFATAHPHHDSSSGALINMASTLGPRSSYRFYTQAPGARPTVLARSGVKRPGYVHSFAMSERYLALTEFPFRVNPIEIPLSGRPFIENFHWDPQSPTRILVFERDGGRLAGEYETEAGFAFHHVGAWEEGGSLVMEYCDHESPAIIDALYLDRLRGAGDRAEAQRTPPRLRRVTIDLDRGRVSSAYRSDHDIEMPSINEDSHYLRPYRYVYGLATALDRSYEAADRLVKLDNQTGESIVWSEPATYVGEPVFVSRPGASREDDGILLSVVLDSSRARSDLLVLDAASMTELARARAPHVIPHGIHGGFYPEGQAS